MLYTRYHHDLNAAFNEFNRGATFAAIEYEKLLGTIDRTGTNKTIDSGQFCLPLFCALLAGRWELARQLAFWSKHPSVKINNPHDTVYIERLLAALILGKDSEIEAILNDEAKVLKRRAPVYASYFDLIVAASGQDQALFNKELSRVEAEFRARSKSRADVVNGYGYGKIDNALNFDFMAVGICKIAAKRGLITQIDSEYIPKVIVDFWQ